MNYIIYKYVNKYNNNNVLYIGKTIDLQRRYLEHKNEAKFKEIENQYEVYYFCTKTKTEMDHLEFCLINKYHPVLNKAMNNVEIIISFNEPKWTLFIPKAIKKDKISDNKKFSKNNLLLNVYEQHKDDYITVKQFSDIVGLSVQAIYQNIKNKHSFYPYARKNNGRIEISTKALKLYNICNNDSDNIIQELKNVIQQQSEKIQQLEKLLKMYIKNN